MDKKTKNTTKKVTAVPEENTVPAEEPVQEHAPETETVASEPEQKAVKSESGEKKSDKDSGVHPSLLIILLIVIIGVIVGGLFVMKDLTRQAEEAEQLAIQQAEEEERLRQEQLAQQAQQELEIKYSRIMHSGLYPEGVSVNGIDISGLNVPEASEKLADEIASHKVDGKVTLTYGDKSYEVKFEDYVKVTNDSEEVLNQAMTAAQDEDMETAIKKAEDLKKNGQNFEITFESDCSALKDLAKKIADDIDRKAESASFTQIDKENHTAETAGAVIGLEVRQDELYEELLGAYEEKDTDKIIIPVTETVPRSSNEDFSYIMLETKTSFQGSNSNRKDNIRHGCEIINGTILLPGDTFSMNDTLGTRTLSNGWKEANAYVSGAHELQAGGGVCQISTTLYNTAVKADLEIVKRQNHSMPVGYIRMGLDATIQSVGYIIDMQFKNNTDSDILIFTWTEGNVLYTRILRTPFDTDEYDEIRLTSEKVETLKPDGEPSYTLDETLGYGEKVADVERRDGSIWQSYKHYYKDGKEVKSEPLAKSTYKAYNGTYRVGPAFPDNYYKGDSGSGSTSITVG